MGQGRMGRFSDATQHSVSQITNMNSLDYEIFLVMDYEIFLVMEYPKFLGNGRQKCFHRIIKIRHLVLAYTEKMHVSKLAMVILGLGSTI